MSTAQLGFAGKKPSVAIAPIDPNKPPVKKVLTEQQKYEKMWTVKDYRAVSPGELAGNTFISVVKPKPDDEVIDFGCGTGRGSLWLGAMGKMNVTMLDFAGNCLDDDLKLACKTQPDQYKFMQHDLMDRLPIKARYGYCTDVMEHIPTDDVDKVLANILAAAQSVFFRISTGPDIMGPKYLDQPLHLTVQNYGWWCNKFIEHGCTILHSQDLGGAVDFYVSAWSKKMPEFQVNTKFEKILDNIKTNVKFGCNHVRPHELQEDVEIMLLCGGPSLNDFKDEIIEKAKAGTKVITMNGSYKWAIDNGITNVNQCMIDARPFNKRFNEPVRDDCYYFISSQCDPEVYEMLPPERTFYWHVNPTQEAVDLINDTYPEYVMCAGGSTVALRAIVLMRILGFKKQVLYGFDSCLRDDEHHAFEQKENDAKIPVITTVMVEGRSFECHPWMAVQATEFATMMHNVGDEFSLTVKGDGLIAYLHETGAMPPDLEN
jgi:hypothetical protein